MPDPKRFDPEQYRVRGSAPTVIFSRERWDALYAIIERQHQALQRISGAVESDPMDFIYDPEHGSGSAWAAVRYYARYGLEGLPEPVKPDTLVQGPRRSHRRR